MLRIGAITVVFYCLSTVTNSILQGLNKMTTPVKHGAISLASQLVAVVVMLVGFKWEIYSLVVGNIIFSLSMCILNAMAIRKVSGYHQEVKKTFVIPFGASFIMGIIILVVWNVLAIFTPEKLATLVTIVLAGISYVVALLKLGALTSDEILAFPKGTKILELLQKVKLVKTEETV